MSKLAELASGQLTNSDNLIVVLIQPDDMPESVVVHWPARPTVCGLKEFPDLTAETVRTLSLASTRLTKLRLWRRL
jgi:hypothetical protein